MPRRRLENILRAYALDDGVAEGGAIAAPLGVAMWRGAHVTLNRPVRVLVAEEDSRAAGELAARADLARRLGRGGRHIVRAVDMRSGAGKVCLVEERVDAATLQSEIAGATLSQREALAVSTQLLAALRFIHGRGIVHGALAARCALVWRDARGRMHLKLDGFDSHSLPPSTAAFEEGMLCDRRRALAIDRACRDGSSGADSAHPGWPQLDEVDARDPLTWLLLEGALRDAALAASEHDAAPRSAAAVCARRARTPLKSRVWATVAVVVAVAALLAFARGRLASLTRAHDAVALERSIAR